MKNNKYLYLITLAYFVLGIININLALLGLLCMGLPLFLLFKNKKKTWCQGYCPRACLYTNCGKLTKKYSRKTPMFLVKGNMKWFMLAYFGVSLSIIAISTIVVANGKPPAEYVKILMILPIKNFPQIFYISSPTWVIHLSYSFYSMMLTTTLLGLILALIYKPRTWCTICPIATISDVYIKSKKAAKI